MATWAVTGQGTDGSTNQTFGATDRIWLNGTNFGDNITVGSYQDSTHRSNSSDVHQCTSVHIHNIKYVDSTHFILDGGSSTALSATVPTTANCPFKFNFSDPSSVATSGAKFYAYDGTTDATAMAGITFQAFERSNTSWTSANGSG